MFVFLVLSGQVGWSVIVNFLDQGVGVGRGSVRCLVQGILKENSICTATEGVVKRNKGSLCSVTVLS